MIDGTESVSYTLPTVIITVSERLYPRDRLVLHVNRLRCVRSVPPTARSLSTIVYSPRTLALPNVPTSPNESERVPKSFPPFLYSVLRAITLYYIDEVTTVRLLRPKFETGDPGE